MSRAPSHALTTNGRISDELKSRGGPEEEIHRRVRLLDGSERYSLSLWALPAATPFDKVDLSAWPQNYIQAAGSADRMVIEVRIAKDGIARQYAIGHKTASDVNQSNVVREVVVWNDHNSAVSSNEVFAASEAADIFVLYYKDGDVSTSYSLRLLSI